MSNNIILKKILSDLDKKRNDAEKDAELQKKELFNKYPDLKNIEDNLNKLYVKKSKYILFNKSKKEFDIIDKEIKELLNKKNNLLLKLNVNDDFFKPKYSCKICNDTGFIEDKDGQIIQCKCVKQKIINECYNKSNIGNLDKENFDSFILDIFSNEVNKEKYNSNISPRENIKQIKNICENFVNNFNNINEKGLLFIGNTGLR